MITFRGLFQISAAALFLTVSVAGVGVGESWGQEYSMPSGPYYYPPYDIEEQMYDLLSEDEIDAMADMYAAAMSEDIYTAPPAEPPPVIMSVELPPAPPEMPEPIVSVDIEIISPVLCADGTYPPCPVYSDPIDNDCRLDNRC